MRKLLLNFINPVALVNAYLYHKKSSKYDKSAYDLELFLYSKILKNDMLHYGYFEDTNIEADAISLKSVEEAQIKYSQKIIEQISNTDDLILDVGCGMGGLSNLIHKKGLKVEALTPDENQIKHLKLKYPNIPCHHYKFEEYDSKASYGTIINSESLQYIPLQKAFDHAGKLLKPNGTWIICDYFRLNSSGINKSSHIFGDFLKLIDANGWEIKYQEDITLHILPTIKVVDMYAERFLVPFTHFAFEKIRFKKPWLFHMISDMKTTVHQKINKELAAVDPKKFQKEKKYMLIVLSKG